MALVSPDTSIRPNISGQPHAHQLQLTKAQGVAIQKKLLDAVGATGASGHLDTRGIKKAGVQIFGTFVGTIKIEGSNDGGTTFTQIGADITAPTFVEVAAYAENIRLNVSAWTSGVITGLYAGMSD